MAVFSFRLLDVNPATGRVFGDSLWMELPGPLADFLADVEGWGPAGWDAAVRARREGVACEPAAPSVFDHDWFGDTINAVTASEVAGDDVAWCVAEPRSARVVGKVA